jgi:NAD(P)-dependent dehydrogenase (short-subunit alcohol dehydrogenase family)
MTRTENPLAGRRALVTGAAEGLGRAFALAFADAGAAVAICDVKPEVGDLGRELDRGGVTVWMQQADLRDANAVRTFVDNAAARLGGVDLVVNNAATYRQTSPIEDDWEQSLDDFHFMADVNYRGTYLVGRAAIPYLVQQGGDLINVTTDHVHTCGYPEAVDHHDAPDCRWASARRPPLGGPRYDVYDSSKWAVRGLTHVWAAALADHGVRVNSFGMGATDTPMIRAHLAAKGAEAPATLMKPDQVAAVLVELILEGPSGRTGDSVELWAGHPCVLPSVSLEGILAAEALSASR